MPAIRQAEKIRTKQKTANGQFAVFASNKNRGLRNGDLTRLDVLGFGQSQRHETLIDLRTDLVGVDRWIEFECALEVFRAPVPREKCLPSRK